MRYDLRMELRNESVGLLCGREVPTKVCTRAGHQERDFWRPQLLQKLLAECLKVQYAADEEEENRVSALVESLFVN